MNTLITRRLTALCLILALLLTATIGAAAKLTPRTAASAQTPAPSSVIAWGVADPSIDLTPPADLGRLKASGSGYGLALKAPQATPTHIERSSAKLPASRLAPARAVTRALSADDNICSFVPRPQVTKAPLSDADGGNRPEYYSTIRLADLDGDGRAELLGRGPTGLTIWHFGPASGSWFPSNAVLPLSDADGWQQPEQRSSIKLADLDDDRRTELIVRTAEGWRAWKYDLKADVWQEVEAAVSLHAAETSGESEREATAQLADLDGDNRVERVTREPDGLHVWRHDPQTNTWSEFGPVLTDLSDGNGWDKPEYHSTIQLADLDGDGRAELIARAADGIQTWRFLAGKNNFEKLTAAVEAFPPFTGNQKSAYDYISRELLNGAPNADIRSQYTNQALKANWNGVYQLCLNGNLKNPVSCPNGLSAAGANVPVADWAAVTAQLGKEFGYVANVNTWFDLHETFINELNASNIVSVSIVSGKIQLPSSGSRDSTPVVFNVLSLIDRVVQGIASLVGQPEVSAISGLFATAFSAAASFSGENSNQPDIRATVVSLQDKLNTHFINAVAANGCLRDYYLQDLTLLESLGLPISQGRYNWDSTLNGKLLAAGRPVYELTLWQTLTPVVWEIGELAETCFNGLGCDVNQALKNPPYPGGYYYRDFEDTYFAVDYFIKLQGVGYGGPWQPPKAALDALFQPPPNGLGVSLYELLTGTDSNGDPNGWNLPGNTPDLVLRRVTSPSSPSTTQPLTITAVHTAASRNAVITPSARLRVRLGPQVDPTTFRAFLNGREITSRFVRPGNSACLFVVCDWTARVTPLDGLIEGRNELRVEARGLGAARYRDLHVFTFNARIAPGSQ